MTDSSFNQDHCGAAVLLACKLVDKHLKIRSIASVLFKLRSNEEDGQNFLNDEKLCVLEKKVK